MVKTKFFIYLYQLTIYPARNYGSMIIVDHIKVHNIRLIFFIILVKIFFKKRDAVFYALVHNLLTISQENIPNMLIISLWLINSRFLSEC